MLPTAKSTEALGYLKYNYLGYGIPKVGKSTFVANFGTEADKVLFFQCEPGLKFLEVYVWRNSKGELPSSWSDFLECARELYVSDHAFSMLAIDTVDILWGWCEEYICKLNDIEHLSDLPFGKGYQMVGKEFSNVCNKLGQKGLAFFFVSHEREYEVQVGPRKETHVDTTLPSGAKKFIHGFVDFIWYFSTDLEGRRYILTDRHDNINAGSRGRTDGEALPIQMEMNAERVKVHLAEL